ncbi:FliM/FliN family flagellar motor switch protein [Poseidonibacter lekithochrous]|uniref:FliM/FliN family flagellar motor switch protein n=1 Tax=Poseidonibacter TaxID=2321187 RepID=UPI001C084672|nr:MULTISPECIES: FliM/FliN family flagellar motor switch protein [Poseidonibacter]MBU3015510.1 FliM/FliN family flagellar motor switch protein [Poseidonibacter lekithochrous]MDO6828809.1 FliM/FliN family flagellar motor switch protein [Poseidonibacter sp. 1_MG-2023]
MASDLSNIFKDELSNTLEQLLSKNSQVEAVSELNAQLFNSTQVIEGSVRFEFKDITSTWNFYIPTISATKFEYFMLGGMGDLKEHIDDEITDAVNEIISNICGSFCTSVNAQGFFDVSSIKSEVKSATILEGGVLSSKKNAYEFTISLDEDKLPVIISFDEIILPYFSAITGKNAEPISNISSILSNEKEIKEDTSVNTTNIQTPKNLELLYNIKLKLSVRLGTKVVLLKDILSWDIGEIIELEQMVNEPLEILVNGIKIGEGEAVIVEGKFGLKIKSIGNDNIKLNQIGL